MQQCIDHGAARARIAGRTSTGMHHHARRFVDHGDVFVFEDDLERDVFGFGLESRKLYLAGDGDRLITF